MGTDFYGDNVRWFLGVVEDTSDPMKLGRVRVRVKGLHTSDTNEIATTDLPWAQVGVPGTEGGVSGFGRSTGILPGAEVIGIFLDGTDSQLPFILASVASLGDVETLNDIGNPSGGTGTTGERVNPSDVIGEGNSNPEKSFNFFVEYGFTPQQAAGIVGNLMQESGPSMSTSIESSGRESSFGIAQWNSAKAAGNRFGLLREFASDIGQDWRDLHTQLRFIIYELENFSYLGMSALRRASTIAEAAIAFETKYEKPSSPARSKRIAYAKEVFNRYGT